MRLLAKVPASVLWLLQDNDTAARNLQHEARSRGVAPERIIFAPRMKLDEHLARHGLADLFLDTLPYNAHTTASDALWAGLPILTCTGRTFPGRVAGSLLRTVGLPELVTSSLRDYETLALKLAGDKRLLHGFRERLLRNRLTTPLFDTGRFAGRIESAYRTMWQLWQDGEEPRSFAVEAIDIESPLPDASHSFSLRSGESTH
jgi:protein O-GlcNAc transferase